MRAALEVQMDHARLGDGPPDRDRPPGQMRVVERRLAPHEREEEHQRERRQRRAVEPDRGHGRQPQRRDASTLLGSSSLLAAAGGGSVHPPHIQEHPPTRLKGLVGEELPLRAAPPPPLGSGQTCTSAGRKVRKLTSRLRFHPFAAENDSMRHSRALLISALLTRRAPRARLRARRRRSDAHRPVAPGLHARAGPGRGRRRRRHRDRPAADHPRSRRRPAGRRPRTARARPVGRGDRRQRRHQLDEEDRPRNCSISPRAIRAPCSLRRPGAAPRARASASP